VTPLVVSSLIIAIPYMDTPHCVVHFLASRASLMLCTHRSVQRLRAGTGARYLLQGSKELGRTPTLTQTDQGHTQGHAHTHTYTHTQWQIKSSHKMSTHSSLGWRSHVSVAVSTVGRGSMAEHTQPAPRAIVAHNNPQHIRQSSDERHATGACLAT